MSEWIKIEYELPRVNDPVLVSNGTSIGMCRIIRLGYFGPVWKVCASNDHVSPSQITHWMPLPKLPEAIK